MCDQTECEELFLEFQEIMSGHTSGAVLQALLDSLSATLAFMVDDLSEADSMIDALPPEMKRDVRRKWAHARKQRRLASVRDLRSLH